MSEPTPPTPAPGDSSDGSAVWALVVGAAILVIAAVLIFAQNDDSSAQGRRAGKTGGGQQANLSAQDTPDGQALGVSPRELDPQGKRGHPRVNPGILPMGEAGMSMAPPRPHKPEPTSFSSASAEIAYYEKKLEEARHNLEQRTLFRERMQRALDNARTPQARDAAEQRSKIVETNFNTAKRVHDDLVKKVADLREKQQQTGNP